MPPPQPPAESHPKRLGKYEIIKHIASGGMGSVYKAVDSKLGRQVAIKVLFANLAANPMMVERFHREAKAAAKLAHENIVTLIDDGEIDGTHYLVMEFVEGVDLYNYIAKKRRLDPEEARKILLQAAKALDHAHHQGVVHRDIKPSNFLLTKKDGKLLVKLADMGLARRVDENEFRVTKDGTTVGTIDYISPEQAHDANKADIRSDIYSLGCTFYHMLSGDPPFPKGSLPERLMAHLKIEPPDICKLNPGVPRTFAFILQKMLAKKPKDRFQTPRELVKVLEDPDKIAYLDEENRLASLEDLARAEADTGSPAPIDDLEEEEENEPRPVVKKKATGKQAARHADDDEVDEDEKKPGGLRVPWWVYAGVGLALVVLVTVVWRMIRPR